MEFIQLKWPSRRVVLITVDFQFQHIFCVYRFWWEYRQDFSFNLNYYNDNLSGLYCSKVSEIGNIEGTIKSMMNKRDSIEGRDECKSSTIDPIVDIN
jgi:hypothetical protein